VKNVEAHDPAPTVGSSWKQAVSAHEKPVARKGAWQLVNSLVPYFALWGLMIWSLGVSYWLTLALAVPAAGFLVRIFVLFHDCGHGSFMKSRRAHTLLGVVLGVVTFTPYEQWRHKHAVHHATASDLDRRGTGDIWTLTVEEYMRGSRWKRLAYRVARNPLVLFLLGPLYIFLIEHRFPIRGASKRLRRGVYWTNASLLAIALVMHLTIGIKAYLLVVLPVVMLSGAAGVWLFYVQHQFEDTYWERRGDWDYWTAALNGSSFYKLPRIFQWFSANIGFHHIHHLSPGIPNYRLEECHNANPVFREVKPITMWSSMRSLSFRLWDEEEKKLVGFRRARALHRERNAQGVSRLDAVPPA